MSEDKDILEQYNDSDEDLAAFVDFADLEELEDIDSLDAFKDLGDIKDLGDVPDLSLQNDSQGQSELSDVFPETEEASTTSGQEVASGVDALQEEELPDDLLSGLDAILGNTEEISDDVLSLDAFTEEAEAMTEDDVSGLDAFANEVETMPEDSVPSLDTLTEEAEMMLGDEIPDLDAIANGMTEDGASETKAMGEDNPETIALEENVENNDADITMESDLLGGLDLGFSMDNSDEGETPLAMEESDGQGIDSMLDGLLDNLDMNGSLGTLADSAATKETEDDSLADILGLGDSSFDSDDMEGDIENLSKDLLNTNGMLPEEQENEKPGFFKRVFGNIVTDEIAQQEREAAEMEEEAAALKEAKDAKAQEEKEAKLAEKKAEKEAKAAERKKIKEARKAERAAVRAQMKAQREEEEAAELEVVGKLNKVGVSIIVIATIAFLVLEIAGTNAFSYISAKNEALDYFEMGKYTEAYQEAIGTDMQNKDEEVYNKIKVVMKVQQSLNAYQNYDRIKYYPEALDALLKGLKRYDANIKEAMDLEVDKDMMNCRSQILSILQTEFGLSEQEAYSILSLEQSEYTNKVVEIGVSKK